MTAEEIRTELKTNILRFNHVGDTPPDVLMLLLYAMAGEFAAQCAEANVLLDRIASAIEGVERR